MKKSAKPKQNRIALLTLLFTLMVFMIFASTMLIMGLAGYILIRSGIWTIEGNAKSDLLFILLIFALASIGVGTFLALTLGRLPFRPVNRLIRGLRRLAEGDYEARLPEGKHYLGKSSPAASTGWRRNCRTQKFSAPTLSTAFLMNLRHPSSPSGASPSF